MPVRVIRVGSIPYGLSALIDEQPGDLIVWLLESEWPEPLARRVEQVLNAMCASARAEASAQPGLHAV